MKCPTSQLLLLCALLLLHQCHRNVFVSADEQQLIVLHDPTRQALSSRSQPASVSPAAATATLCAASGLVPPHGVDQATAAHVEGLVPAKSVLGQAPQALLLLHLAGVTPGRFVCLCVVATYVCMCVCTSMFDLPTCPPCTMLSAPPHHANLCMYSTGSDILHKLQQAWGTAGHTLELDVADSKASAGSLLQAASDVVAANPAADVTVLDHSSLQVRRVFATAKADAPLWNAGPTATQSRQLCYKGVTHLMPSPQLHAADPQGCAGGSCLPHHLTKAMHHCGGKLHAPSPAQQRSSSKGLQGFLELPGLEQKLDMSLPGVKLFALELAALQGSAQHVFAKLKQQPAEELDKVSPFYNFAMAPNRGCTTTGSFR